MQPLLSPGEVAVVDLALDVPAAAGLLDSDEQARQQRFVFARDRVRFASAHTQLRICLGHFLERDPARLPLRVGPRGKPFLDGERLRFNLSHSGDRALLAVALDAEVGVDIEVMRPDVELRALATRMFSAAERAAFAALADAELAPVFYRVWTRKEAFIKLLGDGLSFPLEDFDVSLAPDGGLDACRGRDTAGFRIVSLAAEPGHAAALAVDRPVEQLSRWRYDVRSDGGARAGRWIPSAGPTTR